MKEEEEDKPGRLSLTLQTDERYFDALAIQASA